MRVKLIYGSDTGNTEHVIDNNLLSIFEPCFEIESKCVNSITSDDWESHDFYILSIPTWYDGELIGKIILKNSKQWILQVKQ